MSLLDIAGVILIVLAIVGVTHAASRRKPSEGERAHPERRDSDGE